MTIYQCDISAWKPDNVTNECRDFSVAPVDMNDERLSFLTTLVDNNLSNVSTI